MTAFLDFLGSLAPLISLISIFITLGIAFFGVKKINKEIQKLESERKNIDAEKINIEADTAQKFQGMLDGEIERGKRMRLTIESLQGKIEKLEDKVRQLEEDLEARDIGIAILINQIMAKGEKPIWKHTKKDS